MLKGIDVSHWQGAINWDAVKASGIQFAIIKVGGSDGGTSPTNPNGLYSDGQWLRSNDAVNRLNIPRMFYYFLGGHDPRAEAEHFAAILGDLFVGEGVCLDYEIDHPDEENYLADCAARLKELIGFPPVIYMDAYRVHKHSWQRVRALDCGLWEASWSNIVPDPGPWSFLALWQNTDGGSVPGIAGNVDMDFFNSDSVDIFKKYGKPAAAPPPPPTLPPTPPPAPPTPPPPAPVPEWKTNLIDLGAHVRKLEQDVFLRDMVTGEIVKNFAKGEVVTVNFKTKVNQKDFYMTSDLVSQEVADGFLVDEFDWTEPEEPSPAPPVEPPITNGTALPPEMVGNKWSWQIILEAIKGFWKWLSTKFSGK